MTNAIPKIEKSSQLVAVRFRKSEFAVLKAVARVNRLPRSTIIKIALERLYDRLPADKRMFAEKQ